MVRLEHIMLEFSSQVLYDDISFVINARDKIGLVGRNGAGKTTLLRLLVGEITPNEGQVICDKGTKIGYLPQVLLLNSTCALRDEVMTVAPPSQGAFSADEAHFLAMMDRVLLGLGFKRDDFAKPCSEFSGGWRMRIELAKILLQQPDLLLLDEPTNFLDIESIEWLESFIKTNKCAVVLVSHDKAFLDNVTNRTIEITLGKIYDYDVSYSKFLTLRAERREQQLRAYTNQQKKIADTEAFIEKFRYKATKSVQVQSRIKMLDKLERLEVDQEDTSRLHLRFPDAPRSGDFPLIINDLSVGYATKPDVLVNVNITLKRGDKVAFVGRNGEGKSTLVKTIMQQLTPTEGTLKIGHNVAVAYFAQNEAALLDGEKTIFDTIDEVAVGEIRKRLRDILGAFMFGGEAAEKKVKVLSGGERSRLAMIRLLLEPCNLLILDEPTNHLDIPSKEVLKQAVKAFTGTVICVSHDRDFLDGLVERVYEFKNGGVSEFIGGIYEFLKSRRVDSFKELEKQDEKKKNTSNAPSDGAKNYAEQKQLAAQQRKKQRLIEQTEAEIARLEQDVKALEKMLEDPTQQTTQNFQKYESLKHEIEKKMYEWEILQE